MKKKNPIYKASHEVWIKKGLKLIAKSGHQSLKISTLAKNVKATKGSFYWHFSSFDEYIEALLDEFQDISTGYIISQIDASSGDTLKKLETLFRLTFQFPLDPKTAEAIRLELSIRDWARTQKNVFARCAIIDSMRLEITEKLFKEAGYDNPKERALAVYTYLMGYSILPFFILEKRDFLKEAKSAVSKLLK